jgi:DNA repair ATPase RecN
MSRDGEARMEMLERAVVRLEATVERMGEILERLAAGEERFRAHDARITALEADEEKCQTTIHDLLRQHDRRLVDCEGVTRDVRRIFALNMAVVVPLLITGILAVARLIWKLSGHV